MILKILSNNTLISEFPLTIGAEYIVGRSQDCDIVLDSDNGISRKHLKLTLNEDETLSIELISKLGELRYDNELLEELTIPYNEKFYITEFEFLFEKSIEVKTKNISSEYKIDLIKEESNHENNFENSETKTPTAAISEKNNDEPYEEEITLTAANSLVVVLNILSKSTGKPKKSYELDGNNWIIGRDDTNNLSLPYPFISRKHFELTKTNEGFYIFDFGSANGTLVNGKRLPKNEHIRIYNNDIIEIKTLKIQIELKDDKFTEKVKGFPSDNSSFHVDFDLKMSEEFSEDDFYQPTKNAKLGKSPGKLIIRAIIAIIILGGAYMQLNKKPSTERNIANEKINNKIVENENQTIIKDIFGTAQNSYTQKDHTSCINELERLHKLVPAYKNSKQLESLCKQGLEIEEEQRNQEEKQQQAVKIEAESNKLITQCESKFNSFKSRFELDNCLNKVLILNPGHPKIELLQSRWDSLETQKIEQQKDAVNYKNKISEGKRLYRSAVNQKKSGNLNKSLKSFKKYLYKKYPEQGAFVSNAKREIASINQIIAKQVEKMVSSCTSNHSSGNFKEAVYSCEKVLKKYPNNETASELRYQALKKLRTKARSYYSDGNLEESLGNISAAKEKWNEILKFHVNTDEYYRKAQRKLQKYGSE